MTMKMDVTRIRSSGRRSGTLVLGLVVASLLSPDAAHAKSKLGRVVHVIDADTFRLEDGLKIRIAGIDAAETRQG